MGAMTFTEDVFIHNLAVYVNAQFTAHYVVQHWLKWERWITSALAIERVQCREVVAIGRQHLICNVPQVVILEIRTGWNHYRINRHDSRDEVGRRTSAVVQHNINVELLPRFSRTMDRADRYPCTLLQPDRSAGVVDPIDGRTRTISSGIGSASSRWADAVRQRGSLTLKGFKGTRDDFVLLLGGLLRVRHLLFHNVELAVNHNRADYGSRHEHQVKKRLEHVKKWETENRRVAVVTFLLLGAVFLGLAFLWLVWWSNDRLGNASGWWSALFLLLALVATTHGATLLVGGLRRASADRSPFRLMFRNVPLIDAKQRTRHPVEADVLLGRLFSGRGRRLPLAH